MAKKLKYDALDSIFSEYIRLRDADDNGYCTCCSSGKVQFWKEMDAGHFVSRRHLSTRWLPMNVHAQSRYDNRFNNGNPCGYGKFMLEKYGPTVFDDLEQLKNRTYKMTQFEIKNMIQNYKQQVKQLREEKRL